MKIGKIDLDENIMIIAEIGNNHEGDYRLAEKMLYAAAECGVDAVKFQTIIPEKLVSSSQENRIAQLRKYALSHTDFENLKKAADKANIMFLSTPFDLDSVSFLVNLVPAYKIASGDNNFFPLIKAAALTGKPIILSGGIATTAQLNSVTIFIKGIWKSKGYLIDNLAILHCNVSYPTPIEDVNLIMIGELKKLNVTVGYSDHTIGIDVPVMSAAAGARIIEKHFTLDKNYSNFQDHKLSADPGEMREIVKRIKEISRLVGKIRTGLTKSEKENEVKVRRSLAAANKMKKGTIISEKDITWLRPGTGLPPGKESLILGKALIRDVEEGEIITSEDVN